MTLVRVVPQSVQQYGTNAQSLFGEMHTELKTLVNDVVGVRYFGENAFQFKSQTGQIAADFATKLYADLAGMTSAVRSSTSNIAASLGGAPISIQLEPLGISPPTPEKVDYVDVDTSQLEALAPVVTQHFATLRTALERHMSSLQATDWEGTAKVNAVDQVGAYTESAKAKCLAAETAIGNYIRSQLQSVLTADK